MRENENEAKEVEWQMLHKLCDSRSIDASKFIVPHRVMEMISYASWVCFAHCIYNCFLVAFVYVDPIPINECIRTHKSSNNIYSVSFFSSLNYRTHLPITFNEITEISFLFVSVHIIHDDFIWFAKQTINESVYLYVK